MIKNERQLSVARRQLALLNAALKSLETANSRDLLAQARMSSLKTDAKKLEQQITKYQNAAQGHFDIEYLGKIDQVGEKLVLARVALGLSQEQLAKEAKMKTQQVQRYEKTSYTRASLSVISRMANLILDLRRA